MKILIASDHAGFELKEKLKAAGLARGLEMVDCGPADATSTDYPTYAQKVCAELSASKSNQELLAPAAVLVCGSGVGMSITANRYKKIRAVLAMDPKVAELSRQHNASNILCLGSRLVSESQALAILTTWLATPFEGGRHQKRIDMIDDGK